LIEIQGINRGKRRRHWTIVRIVNCRVEAAKGTHGSLDELLHRRGVAHIGGDSDGATAIRPDALSKRIQSPPVTRCEYYGGTGTCKCPSGCCTDASAGASDKCYLTLK
jgi:hypothetical protein